jgi:hypothetical protein
MKTLPCKRCGCTAAHFDFIAMACDHCQDTVSPDLSDPETLVVSILFVLGLITFCILVNI